MTLALFFLLLGAFGIVLSLLVASVRRASNPSEVSTRMVLTVFSWTLCAAGLAAAIVLQR